MHNRVLFCFNYIRDRFRGWINSERSGQLIAEFTRRVDPRGACYGALPTSWAPPKLYMEANRNSKRIIIRISALLSQTYATIIRSY